jgi:hypothetical protein
MFLTMTGGNITHARLAAAQTLESYRARTDCDLIVIGQIIAFGLAALGSLSLSMTDGLSLPMILRLRGGALGSSRAAEQNRRTHRRLGRPHPLEPNPDEAQLTAAASQRAERVGAVASQPAPPPPTARHIQDGRAEALWANAFTEVANEVAAEIPNLPPAERKIATMRAAAFSCSAHELLSGAIPPLLRPGNRTFG